jgi:hypothetical protein
MRRIREAVLPLAGGEDDLPKTVREYHAQYKGVSQILDEHREIVDAAHEDLKKLSQGGRKGRSGDFTSETILRALIVHAIEGGSFRETVEFGHVMLLCQTGEKFITDYEVFAERPADCTLTEPVIERHEKLFGKKPQVLAGDKGFCSDAAKYAELAEQVETLAIPRRMRDFADKVLAVWQRFRSGIEGMIAGLKRAFRPGPARTLGKMGWRGKGVYERIFRVTSHPSAPSDLLTNSGGQCREALN